MTPVRRCHGAESWPDLVGAFSIFVLRRNRRPFTFSVCMYKQSLKEAQRRRCDNVFIGGAKHRFGFGSLGELTGAFCSLRSFTRSHLKGLLMVVLARTMIPAELAEKRICVSFIRSCCMNAGFSSTVVWLLPSAVRLSGIAAHSPFAA